MNFPSLKFYNFVIIIIFLVKLSSPASGTVFTALAGLSGLNTHLHVRPPETLSPVQ